MHNEVKGEMNKLNAFSGEIINRDMMGKTTQDLIDRWNEDHPDDLIVVA